MEHMFCAEHYAGFLWVKVWTRCLPCLWKIHRIPELWKDSSYYCTALTFTFHNDHQRDIYNSLAHILLCVWYTAQLDTSASPLKLESHSHEAPVAGSDLSSLGHTWSSTWILGHTSHSLVSAVSLESSGLSWTSSSSSSQPHPHRGGQFHLLVSH